ncbi:nucleotidyltransferase family protein [Candidatus Sumerlaeota bacterium]|nr:nucleotidyltransferase family protein [Candidatus Sumerlaeota bacterium]
MAVWKRWPKIEGFASGLAIWRVRGVLRMPGAMPNAFDPLQGERESMNAILPKKLDDATRKRVLRLCGLLSRPALDESHRRALRAMIGDPQWKPIPRLASWHLLEPQFLHHLERTFGGGFDEAKVFLPRDVTMKGAPTGADLVLAYFHRAKILERVLSALSVAGVQKVLLIKGAALAPLYEAPATRQMCDADLVVAPGDLAIARTTLAAEKFIAHHQDSNEVWHDAASGFHIDLQQLATPLAHGIFERATPHPCYRHIGNVAIPTRGDHLLLIAIHAARNGGNRIWRDVCDANLLLEGATKADSVCGAFAAAEEFKTGYIQAAAFFDFVDEVSPEPSGQPVRSPILNDNPVVNATLSLYRELSTGSMPPVALNLVAVSTRPMSEHIARLMRARDSDGGNSSQWAETDPVMGTMAGGGTFARQMTKFKVLLHLWRSGELQHYRRLVEMQNIARAGNTVFQAPDGQSQAGGR